MQDAAVFQHLTAGSEDQQMIFLQLQAAQPCLFKMSGHLLFHSCLKGDGYMQLPKCFAHWQKLDVRVWGV